LEFVSSLNAGSSDLVHSLAVRLMQHLIVPTFVLDAERRVTIWNHACERLTGIPATEMVGTNDHWRAFYNEPRHCLADVVALDQYDKLAELYAAHTSPGEFGLGLRAENWCVMPIKGERRYLAVDAGPIFDDHGKLIAVVETLRDMTDQKRAEMTLQNLATKDSLTGLANRRSLDEKLQLEWKCNQRCKSSLAFILADVDHFKNYNDHYGHQKGDDCLRAVAGAIGATVFRPADMTARYGGEEFAVVMPNTDLAGAKAVAERIREAIVNLALAHCASPTAPHVTLSMGVSVTVPDAGSSVESLIAAADAALYQAKHAGRNRVGLAEPPAG
jgi:diguanylate cyclase (GGDEF)-like protein/PAS domain S-box-containing protein